MEYLAVFPSLFAFLVAFLFGKNLGDRAAQVITSGALILSAIVSCILFYDVILQDNVRTLVIAEWIVSGDFAANWSLRFDSLSVVMLCVITIVSACVHVYSIGYMSHDDAKARFMSYLSLFTFAMIMLVTADNLLQLFFGWEGVGLASYLLIGFWNHKHSANGAAMKAFIVNRVGDLGLVLGIMATFMATGTIQFDDIFASVPELDMHFSQFLGFEVHTLTLIGLLLFIGAVGKSAQLGLHTWLPDAMEGPTPVSGLIHAATMVTAGVFLVARFSPLYEYAPFALQVITYVGATTAFVAATIGLTQFDIKRVIAYSTMSQLGYMFFALGVSAYGAAIFHLVTHAFFKALLFLGAGSVIHAMSDEQDMRKMGGIWYKIPVTYTLMWIGSLALCGVPFFAGYYSKDIILEAVWADNSTHGMYAFVMGVIAAFMTAFYSFRLIFMTFHGEARMDEKVWAHVHESPKVMLYPLYLLAVGALISGFALYGGFVGGHHGHHGDGHGAVHAEAAHETIHGDALHQDTHLEGHDAAGHELKSMDDMKDAWNKEEFWGDAILVKPENDTVEAAHSVPLMVKLTPTIMGVLGIALAFLFYIRLTNLPELVRSRFSRLHTLFFRKWFFDEIYNAVFVKSAWWLGRFFSFVGDRLIIDGVGPNGMAFLSKGFGQVLSRLQTGFIFHYAFLMMLGVLGLVTWMFYRAHGFDTLIGNIMKGIGV